MTALNVALSVLKNNVEFADFVCNNIARPYLAGMASLTAHLPFSFFELCLIAVIAFGIVLFVRFILHAKRRDGLALRLVFGVASAVLAFSAFYTTVVGFAYTRTPADLPSYNPTSKEEAVLLATKYYEDMADVCARIETDNNGRVIFPFGKEELCQIINDEYDRLTADYPEIADHLYDGAVALKTIVNSWFMSECYIAGIYTGPTGEANVNGDMPFAQIISTACHEVAHGKGVMREDEANAFAYLITLTSNNDYVRFAGYLATYTRMAEVLQYYTGSAATPNPIIAEHWTQYYFWQDHGKLADLAEKINDLYLKLQGYIKGVLGYRDVSVITPSINPDTGEVQYDITYSPVQKLIFAIVRDNLS